MTETNANRQIARAAGTEMIAIVLGQITGLVRSIIVAGAFGASPELDAFTAANRVSETLFLLVAGGALGSAFIPTFTGLLAKNKKDSAWRLASALANAVTLSLSLLALLFAIFAPQVVRYALAPGFSEKPELFVLTVSLLRIQLISAVLFGLGGLIVGILNAHKIFLVPALTPAMYQLGIIFGAVALAPSMGIYGLAWGVVIGAALYLLLQVPTLIKQRGAYSFTFGLENPDVRKVVFLMGPRLLGVAVVQLNFWVNIRLASQMIAGSVASLSYGFSLMIMAQAAIAQSVAIAAMPTFSAQHALGQKDEMRASLGASLRGILLMAIPASVGLILLREQLVSFLFQRGKFDEQDVQMTAWALLWYAAGIVGHSV
ncbi:MAG: murein biosynthesis integral membrane protein MurJ, partial [Anaerolineales bacterium]|nr:murein biosynthesis integral membrane protein MurJ [Anaerolineales bacterium]